MFDVRSSELREGGSSSLDELLGSFRVTVLRAPQQQLYSVAVCPHSWSFVDFQDVHTVFQIDFQHLFFVRQAVDTDWGDCRELDE